VGFRNGNIALYKVNLTIDQEYIKKTTVKLIEIFNIKFNTKGNKIIKAEIYENFLYIAANDYMIDVVEISNMTNKFSFSLFKSKIIFIHYDFKEKLAIAALENGQISFIDLKNKVRL